MKKLTSNLKLTILKLLFEAESPIGSPELSQRLEAFGYALHARTLRLYLKEMEQEGLVHSAQRGRNGGRRLTVHGEQELREGIVVERVGLTSSRMDEMMVRMTFDLKRRTGTLPINITEIPEAMFYDAIQEILPVLRGGLGIGDYVGVYRAGEEVGRYTVPPKTIALGTVCGVILNGVLLKHSIPITSRFGGLLEYHQRQPLRFSDVTYYDGTSTLPVALFMKAGMTSCRDAARTGSGSIGASFRDIPSAALSEVKEIGAELERSGIARILYVGKANQPVFGFPLPYGRTGIIMADGLNPMAAVVEAGIPANHHPMETLGDVERLRHFRDLTKFRRI